MRLRRPSHSVLFAAVVSAACSSAPAEPIDSGETFEIRPRTAILSFAGDSVSLSAERKDSRGRPSDCPNTRWTSLKEDVATVNGSGKVKAKSAGLATILAVCGTMEASASVQVAGEEHSGRLMKAFPEAEGWGALALSECRTGGVEVIPVTHLGDSGPGSLREAIASSRDDRLSIITFSVGGYLDLESVIELRNRKCLYIAGQTAPGDGITLRIAPGVGFYTKEHTSDVVIRHLRFRGGYGGNVRGPAAIRIGSGKRYVIDHLSISWTTDKAIVIKKSATSWSYPVSAVSVQRSILSEIFAVHPTAMQISGENNDGATDWRLIQDISVHRNLFAHNSHRNPNVTTYGAEVINNLVYNWRQGAVQSTRESRLDVVSNAFLPGPMTDGRYLWEVTWVCNHPGGYEPSLYVAGNIGPHNLDPTADNWSGESRMVACYYDTGGAPGAELPERMRRNAPLAQPDFPVDVLPATAVKTDILSDVGASSGLTCDGRWIPRYDAVDLRVLNDVRNGTGPAEPPENESAVGGFPTLSSGPTCEDRDGDGMPDEFERRFGFDPDDPRDAAFDSDGDGYFNVEEYVNASMS